MGFDLGAVIGNLLISYFSQDGHEAVPGARDTYRAWILSSIEQFWSTFERAFLALWRSDAAIGDGYPRAMFEGPAGQARLDIERRAYMARLLADSLAFAGAKMNRRVLGLAHNIDLEWIKDAGQRARCEARVLTLARDLVVNPHDFPSITAVTLAAADLQMWRDPLSG